MPPQEYLLRHEPYDEPQYISNFNTYPIDSQPHVSTERLYSEPATELPEHNDNYGLSKDDSVHRLNLNIVLNQQQVNHQQINQQQLYHQMNLNYLGLLHQLRPVNSNQLGHNNHQLNILPNHHMHRLSIHNGPFTAPPHPHSAVDALAPNYGQYPPNSHLGVPRTDSSRLNLEDNVTLLALNGLILTPLGTNLGTSSLAPGSNSHLDANGSSQIQSAMTTNLPPFIQVLPEESLMDNLNGVSQLTSNLPRGVDPSFSDSLGGSTNFDPDSTNKKVAPRSKDLYRIGPPFGHTVIHRPVYCVATNLQLFPQIDCRLDRGFELGEAGNWIGYKRNYFTMVLAFTFQNWSMDAFVENEYQVMDKNDPKNRLLVSYFALSVLAKCSDPEVQIGLVQHTPKRDKGPQYNPPVYPAVPGSLPDHQTVMASSNKRNMKKIRTLGRIFSFDRAAYYKEHNMDPQKDQSILRGYPSDVVSRVARFERIQFSASIRVKQKSNHVHKFFTLIVELSAVVNDEDRTLLVPIASCTSAPLLVRGRSPSNYPREKTSGYRDKEESV